MCGLVFCDEHSSRRLRLGADNAPADVGEPQRVCEECFQSAHAPAKPPQSTGTALRLHVAGDVTARDLSATFAARRAAHNASKRGAMVPLLDAYSRLCQQSGPLARQRVVAWEADQAATRCGVCYRVFTPLLRRHHCRLCGSVVCADCSAKRTAPPADGAFVYRACSRCHDLQSRDARARAFAQARAAAASSPFASSFEALSAAAKGVRREMDTFESQVSELGTPAATASVDDVYATQARLERELTNLMGELKRFAALPSQPHEAVLKDGVKRAPLALLTEATPRFHALKRTLEFKALQKRSLAPLPPEQAARPPPPPSASAASAAATAPPQNEGGAGGALVGASVGGTSLPPMHEPAGSIATHTAGSGADAMGVGAAAGVAPPLEWPTVDGVRSAVRRHVSGVAQNWNVAVASAGMSHLCVSQPTSAAPGAAAAGAASSAVPPAGSAPAAASLAGARACTNPWGDGANGPPVASAPFATQADGPADAAAAAAAAATAHAPPPLAPSPPTRAVDISDGSGAMYDAYAYDAYDACGATVLLPHALAAPPAPPPPPVGPIALDEYLIAKRALIDLSRSSMLYARPQLAEVVGVAQTKDTALQSVLNELNHELDSHAEDLGLDPAEQLREFTAAITAARPSEAECHTKAELLSRLLGVATGACRKLEEDVSPTRFVAARAALHALRERLAQVYESECIPY